MRFDDCGRRETVPAPLHVHVIIDALGWGGAEMLLADFVVGAAALDLKVTVAYLQDRDGSAAAERLRACGVTPQLLPIGGLLRPAAHRMVRTHVAALAPDLVHAHLEYADLLAGRAARTLGLPAVSTLHNMQPEPEPGARERVKERLISAARRRHMDVVIAVSEPARQAAVAARWATADQSVTVHNGIVGTAQPGAGRRLRAELGLAPGAPVALTLAVLRPGKGHVALLAAWPEVRRRVPGAVLLIAGDGPLRSELEQRAARVHGVHLLGHRDDVMALLDGADVAVHPTEFDAFPTALLEALAAGTPIVATRVGGIPEILQDGVHGRLVEVPARSGVLAAAVAGLLGDADLRRAFGAAGRHRFEQRFTVERWVAATRVVYERALRTHAARRK